MIRGSESKVVDETYEKHFTKLCVAQVISLVYKKIKTSIENGDLVIYCFVKDN